MSTLTATTAGPPRARSLWHSLAAELLVIRRRTSTWVLLGIWLALTVTFAYVVPALVGAPTGELLPQSLATQVVVGFPFFGGVFALILGVLSMGGEYAWDTLKTVLTQRPRRATVLAAKVVALAVALAGFALVAYLVGGIASVVVGVAQGAAMAAPSPLLLAQSIASAWLILLVWGTLGVALAALTRGTAMAVGIGLLYAFVVEGLLALLASQVSWLDPLMQALVRTNAYSLVIGPLGLSPQAVADAGPGSFFGPFVAGEQALAVLLVQVAVFVVTAGLLVARRDVV